ncbi:hypothetical protein CSB37_00920 [bacterium DOLZORAL124_38_8]|nr:MAG: hypothetical protein CSB37_00920 [bacterium DOLZORAL124_38_8]
MKKLIVVSLLSFSLLFNGNEIFATGGQLNYESTSATGKSFGTTGNTDSMFNNMQKTNDDLFEKTEFYKKDDKEKVEYFKNKLKESQKNTEAFNTNFYEKNNDEKYKDYKEYRKNKVEPKEESRKKFLLIRFVGLNKQTINKIAINQIDSLERDKKIGEKITVNNSYSYQGKENVLGKWIKTDINVPAGDNAIWIKIEDLEKKDENKVLLKITHPAYYQKIIDTAKELKKTMPEVTVNLIPKDASNTGNKSPHLTLGEAGYDPILKDNLIHRAGDGFTGFDDKHSVGNEDKILKSFFSKKGSGIMVTVLRVLGTIGILYLLIGGIRYIFTNGDEESAEKAKNQIVWALVGLIILSLAEFIGFEFINPYEKDILGTNEVVNSLKDKVEQIIRVLEYAVGGLFLVNGSISAYDLITSRGQDENLDNEKNFVQTFIWGAGFILFAEVIVRIVASDISRSEQINMLSGEIGGIINFILTFFAGASALMLIISALYYVVSLGDDERVSSAKNMIRNSAIAFVIAFSSYVLAQFMIV